MRVFISYRRDDSSGHVGRLVDTFKRELPHPVFVDWGIWGAEDFMNVISAEIDASDAVVAVIGQNWTGTNVTDSARRIDDPQDFVRREIERALDANKVVVPVLVSGASMPRDEDLPASVKRLTHFNAVELSDRDWKSDAETLVRVLMSLKWARPADEPHAAVNSELVTVAHLPGKLGASNTWAWPASGRYVRGRLIVTGAMNHKLHLMATSDGRVLGSIRLRRRPRWTPTSLAFEFDCAWIADPASRSVWRVGSLDVSRKDVDGAVIGPRSGLRLKRVRRRRMQGRPFAIAASSEAATWPGVWVLVRSGESRRDGAGALLRMSRDLEIDVQMSLPEPRQLAIGIDAVWVVAADLVAKFDVRRKLPSGYTRVGFNPRCIAVDREDVWVGGAKQMAQDVWTRGPQLLAQLDAPSGRLLGSLELPGDSPVTSLAIVGGHLWAATPDTLYRIDPRRHDVIQTIAIASPEGFAGHLPHAELIVGAEHELYVLITEEFWGSRVVLLRLSDQIHDTNS